MSNTRNKSGKFKEWQQSNPDKTKEYNTRRYSNKKHKISLKEWDACRLYFDYRCAYCGMSWEEHKEINNQDLHKEHVNHNGENDLSNCIPSCRSCNSSKHDFLFDDWYNENNPYYNDKRISKIILWLTTDHKKFILKKFE